MRLTETEERPISDIKKLLTMWIGDQTQKHIPLITVMIMAKAKLCEVEIKS